MTDEKFHKERLTGIPYGYCQCGCGEKTTIAKRARAEYGWIKGEPIRFRQGHSARIKGNSHYKGLPCNHGDGYLTIFNNGKHRLQHRVIAEQLLGEPLPPNAEIHHYGDKTDQTKMIICENHQYHCLIEQRERAYKESGHADWRRCSFCGEYDSPDNLYIPPNRGTIEHRRCGREYRKEYYEKRRAVA